MLTGLSVARASKAGLFNIGADGQLLMGGFAAAVVGAQLAGQPPLIAISVAVLAGALAGAAWGSSRALSRRSPAPTRSS